MVTFSSPTNLDMKEDVAEVLRRQPLFEQDGKNSGIFQ